MSDNISNVGAFYKWSLRDAVLKQLYAIPLDVKSKEIARYIKVIGDSDLEIRRIGAEAYIYFGGKRYYSKEAGLSALIGDTGIHYKQAYPNEEQTIHLEQLIQEYRALQTEKAQIETYLNKVLNAAVTGKDILKLLPSSAKNFIAPEKLVGNKPGLPDEEIAKLRKECHKYAVLLNERLLTNLITKETV